MLERFKRPKTQESLSADLPDVKFYGFANADLPYGVGIDIIGYQRLLQESLHIDPKVIPHITLRFLGFHQPHERAQIESDATTIVENKQVDFLRTVSVYNELVAIKQLTGIPVDQIEPEDAIEIIKGIIATKLLLESVSIKKQIAHKKLHRTPSSIIKNVLDESTFYIGGFALGEAFLRNYLWSSRMFILLYSFTAAKIASYEFNKRVDTKHDQLNDKMQEIAEKETDFKTERVFSPCAQQQWLNLINVYPVTPNNTDL